MMRKFLAAAAAFCLMATLLCGCRSNVSSREDGMITDPTGTSATMPGTDTFPSYNTQPTETSRPDASTDTTQGTENNATEGMNGNDRSRRPNDIK